MFSSFQYSIFVDDGNAIFEIKTNGVIKQKQIDLKENGWWTGENPYESVNKVHHFISRKDGELIATKEPYNRVVYIEEPDNDYDEPKIFTRARQFEYDFWMRNNFPDSTNAKIYNILEKFHNQNK